MFSSFRNHFGIPGVIAVIALVFAMLGGAYAANDSGGGKATASAKGPRGPKGPKGAKGATGAAGPQGLAGPAGANGKDGANGSDGSKGATGATGATGKGTTGPTGPTGSTGATGQTGFTETLPSGKTETGVVQGIADGGKNLQTSISLPIPLAAVISGENVHLAPNANCPGTVEVPKAEPGHACFYPSYNVQSLQFSNPTTFAQGIGQTGALGSIVSESANEILLLTWAVSAP
jgi:Collagen triple helix repeat (20 copies)